MKEKFLTFSIIILFFNSCNVVKNINRIDLNLNGWNLKASVKSVTHFNNDSIVTSFIEFDKNGLQTKAILAKPQTNVNYIYKNKVLKEINSTNYYREKEHRSKEILIYDSKKRIIERIIVSEERENDYTIKNKFKHSGKEKITTFYPRDKPSYSIYYFFEDNYLYEKDASNNLISTSKLLGETYRKIKEFKANGEIKTEYIYNTKHDLITLNFYQNGSIINYIKYGYEYDNKNNWVLQEVTNNRGNNYTIRREIEYYN